ncbi:MAG: HAD family hydrolase [Dysgonamonadaceae bacterium]|jgi:phosphoglycolate phosphatase|nr:HAD family hydrolase [Dysgonamonadaceae bacterium]
MNNFQAVIFDLDGTLVDSIHDIADAMNRTLMKYSFPIHSYDAYRYFVGEGLRKLVFNALPEGKKSENRLNECFHAVLEDYLENYLVKSKLYDEIDDLLNILSEKKIKMAILSNKADAITQKICRVLLQAWNFNVILGATDRFPCKPNPESALFIAEKLNISPENILYIGDTGIDMETANRAGMFAVGVTWGFRKRAELEQSGAKIIIDNPLDLLTNGMDELPYRMD